MTPAIRAFGLTKTFRRQRPLHRLFSRWDEQQVVAVDDLTLEVTAGRIFGLLGPNGAGKTTLIKLLCTLLLPSGGTATVCGYDIVREAQKVREVIGLVASEERSFFWRLTARQNLDFFAALHHIPRANAARRIDKLLELLDLRDVSDVRFNEFSTGMRQRLAIARGLLGEPTVLFMDEPTKGLDPLSSRELLALIRERVLGDSTRTIVLTSHVLRDIEQLCDGVVVVNHGHVIASGSMDELRALVCRHVKYRLRLRRVSDEMLAKVGRIRGVEGCRKVGQEGGLIDAQLDLLPGTDALSTALRQILQDGGIVVECTAEELPLDEVFSRIVEPEAARPRLAAEA